MIIPSIDLMNGKAVQLKQGKEKMLEDANPIELAARFDRFGDIAVIDLDAAMGRGSNRDLIRRICSIATCRVGGGIREVEDSKELVSFGASKIIIGTRAFENDTLNHGFLEELASAVGKNRIMVAVDALQGEIVTRAWKHKTGLRLLDVVKEVEPYASRLLFTCVEKEGCLQGTDMETIAKLKDLVSGRLTVAGGVHSMEEIRELARLDVDVQLGMALYKGQIKLEEAFIEFPDWDKGLIPTITCDRTGQVLMLAYSSRESLKETFAAGRMWYFSRSRNKLWMKGETSGNTQELVRMRVDCDNDALLAVVDQKGVACHLEEYSCFGDKTFSWRELYDVIRDRFENPVPGSYTATLDDKTLSEKILEEARELVEAKTSDEVVWEAADLLYFMTVLLAKAGIPIEDVLGELRRRRRK